MDKKISIWKLNNTFINNLWVKEEIKREIRKFFKMNENENTTYLLEDNTKTVLRKISLTLNAYTRKEEKAQMS